MLCMEEDTNDLFKHFIKLTKFLIYLILFKNLFYSKTYFNLFLKNELKDFFSMYSI